MGLTIYSTLSRKQEPFTTLEPGVVRMYVCGPTVYDKAHIGHAMSTLVFDVIRRYLEYKGYRVNHVMNYTDVDDKVIRRAQELGVDPMELAERYVQEYDLHLEQLRALPVSVKPRVSQEISAILEMVEGLIEGGYAYVVDGDVYFSVDEDPNYGKLSQRSREAMLEGARVEVDERKRDPADFALWKAAKPGEPSWPSPWGPGRPGWHIECSAMNLHHLGEQIDIHGGGNDLVFPHHENEIAQSESLTEKPFARYWIHNGMMQLGGQDMSKSTGNVLTIEGFLREHEADVLRTLVLNASYRKPLAYSEEAAQAAASGLARLRSGLRPAIRDSGPGGKAEDGRPQPANSGVRQSSPDLASYAEQAEAAFVTHMDDDLNTAGALSVLFDLVREINRSRDAGASDQQLEPAQRTLGELAGVLGLRLEGEASLDAQAQALLSLLVDVRERLRRTRQFELADHIRERLADLGVTLEDSAGGTTWRLQTPG